MICNVSLQSAGYCQRYSFFEILSEADGILVSAYYTNNCILAEFVVSL